MPMPILNIDKWNSKHEHVSNMENVTKNYLYNQPQSLKTNSNV